jgi:hypothetical protein
MKILNKIIPIAGYPFDLMVSFNETDKMVRKHLKKFGITPKKDNQESIFHMDSMTGRKGRYVMFVGKQSILRLNFYPHSKDPDEVAMLAHEIFHAVHCFFMEIQTPLKNSTQEPYAYLIQWLTREIYSLI